MCTMYTHVVGLTLRQSVVHPQAGSAFERKTVIRVLAYGDGCYVS